MFSQEWTYQYKKKKNLSKWPWSDLVVYFNKFVKLKKKSNILELGCGMGANINFIKSLGHHYYGCDASEISINELKKQFYDLKNNLFRYDFTQELPKMKFDVIIDRSSVTCNPRESIIKAIDLSSKSLKKNGVFIGIDWFSKKSTDFKNSLNIVDIHTRKFATNESPYFSDLGCIHFANLSDLKKIFSNFTLKHIQHKTIQNHDFSNHQISTWNFVAKKNV